MCDGDTKYKLKSKSSQTFSTQPSEYDTDKRKQVRPHMAQARTRPPSGRSSIPHRRASANIRNETHSPFLINKDSIYIKTGQSFEKLLDNGPIDTPVMLNNFINTSSLKPQSASVEKEPSITSVLCPVQEDNEDDETDDADTIDATTDVCEDTADERNATSNNMAQKEVTQQSALSLKFQRRLRHKLERAQPASAVLTHQTNNRSNSKQFEALHL